MQKSQINWKGYTFEVQLGPCTIRFFEIARLPVKGPQGEVLHTHHPVGGASYSVHDHILHLSSGSMGLGTERFAQASRKAPGTFKRLTERDVLFIQEQMLHHVGGMLFERHKGIQTVSGGIHDSRSGLHLAGEDLLGILRGNTKLRDLMADEIRTARMGKRRAGQRVMQRLTREKSTKAKMAKVKEKMEKAAKGRKKRGLKRFAMARAKRRRAGARKAAQRKPRA